MRALKLLCLPALFLMCCSVCRGQDLTTLNGNWKRTGSWVYLMNDVRLFLSLDVQGDEIFGSGDVWTSCEGGGALPLHGRIASDGTFVLRTDYGIPEWERKITISGKFPRWDQHSGPAHLSSIKPTKSVLPKLQVISLLHQCPCLGEFIRGRFYPKIILRSP